MSRFLKQFIFIASIIAILTIGGLVIYSATPLGNLKINPILGHDLDLNALYYGQAGNNTVHDITTQDISISAWVKVDVDSTNGGGILGKSQSNTGGYMFYLSTSGSNKLTILINDKTDTYAVVGNTAMNDNKWHYVTGIIDRSDATQSKVFIDGVDNTASRSGTLANVDSIDSALIMAVGSWHSADAGHRLDGQIRDVKLYYAAGDHWSDAQVLYQAQHPFDYTSNAGTLTDYWRLDEGSGTTLYGKVNNLTLSNVLAWTTQPKIKMVKQENTTTTGNNPVGWWKMDEGTASSTLDSSGNGNTGTLTGGVQWATGKLGKGLSFDGVNDYVSASTLSSVGKNASSFSINLWVNFGNVSNRQVLIDNTNSNQDIVGINLTATGILTAGIWNGSTYFAKSCTNQSLVASRFYFVSAVYDGTSMKLYIDGVLQSSSSTSPSLDGAVGFRIGSGTDPSDYFNGIIDDVRIYNRALSAGEVAQMYNSTKDGYLGNIKVSTGLVGYWKLDDNNALTSVIDYSGKGNTGTAYSSTATSTSVLSTSTAMIGRAMGFDGGNDYIDVADNTIFNSDSITVSAWVYVNDWSMVDTNRAILQYRYPDATPSGYYLALIASNGFSFNTYNGVGSAKDAVSTGYAISTWYHVVGTYDYLQAKVRLYVNGVLKDTDTTMIGPILYNDYPSNLQLQIGRDYGGGTGRYFNGLIDEVKIWNYARTAEQIKNDYVLGTKHREE